MNKIEEQARQLFEALAGLRRAMTCKKQPLFQRFKLTHPQVEVLYLLSESESKSIKEISEFLQVSSSAATQLVVGLEKIGLASRLADSTDRRVVKVSLSPKGKKKIQEFKEEHLKSMQSFMKQLTEQERGLLISIPQKMINHLKKTHEQSN